MSARLAGHEPTNEARDHRLNPFFILWRSTRGRPRRRCRRRSTTQPSPPIALILARPAGIAAVTPFRTGRKLHMAVDQHPGVLEQHDRRIDRRKRRPVLRDGHRVDAPQVPLKPRRSLLAHEAQNRRTDQH